MTNSINVVVAQKRPIQVSTNATATAIVTNNPITLKPDTNFTVISGGGGSGVNELDQLIDVDISQEQDGSVLQYNATANNYQVKPLNIDGGVF